MATGARFVREIFTGVYASDFGLWNTNVGEVIRHQHAIGAYHVRLLFNIVPESAVYLGEGRSRILPVPLCSMTGRMHCVFPG